MGRRLILNGFESSRPRASAWDHVVGAAESAFGLTLAGSGFSCFIVPFTLLRCLMV